MEVKVSTSVNMMLNRNIPVQLVSNSLYMILNTKTGIVCQPGQRKWSLKTIWSTGSHYSSLLILRISMHISQKYKYYSNLLQSSRDHPGANESTCQRRQPLPDSGPLLNISLQSSMTLHLVHQILPISIVDLAKI